MFHTDMPTDMNSDKNSTINVPAASVFLTHRVSVDSEELDEKFNDGTGCVTNDVSPLIQQNQLELAAVIIIY